MTSRWEMAGPKSRNVHCGDRSGPGRARAAVPARLVRLLEMTRMEAEEHLRVRSKRKLS